MASPPARTSIHALKAADVQRIASYLPLASLSALHRVSRASRITLAPTAPPAASAAWAAREAQVITVPYALWPRHAYLAHHAQRECVLARDRSAVRRLLTMQAEDARAGLNMHAWHLRVAAELPHVAARLTALGVTRLVVPPVAGLAVTTTLLAGLLTSGVRHLTCTLAPQANTSPECDGPMGAMLSAHRLTHLTVRIDTRGIDDDDPHDTQRLLSERGATQRARRGAARQRCGERTCRATPHDVVFICRDALARRVPSLVVCHHSSCAIARRRAVM